MKLRGFSALQQVQRHLLQNHERAFQLAVAQQIMRQFQPVFAINNVRDVDKLADYAAALKKQGLARSICMLHAPSMAHKDVERSGPINFLL